MAGNTTTTEGLNMIEAANSNFYSPEEYRDERSGSNYNFNIYNSIIQILSKHEKLGYNDLRAKVENLLGKSIGPSTYVGHIKRLNDVGILRKEDHGIGKKVEYSLTEDATKQVRLVDDFEANDDLEGIVKEQNVSPVEKSKSATVARKKII